VSAADYAILCTVQCSFDQVRREEHLVFCVHCEDKTMAYKMVGGGRVCSRERGGGVRDTRTERSAWCCVPAVCLCVLRCLTSLTPRWVLSCACELACCTLISNLNNPQPVPPSSDNVCMYTPNPAHTRGLGGEPISSQRNPMQCSSHHEQRCRCLHTCSVAVAACWAYKPLSAA
jgi:hypothetical protein